MTSSSVLNSTHDNQCFTQLKSLPSGEVQLLLYRVSCLTKWLEEIFLNIIVDVVIVFLDCLRTSTVLSCWDNCTSSPYPWLGFQVCVWVFCIPSHQYITPQDGDSRTIFFVEDLDLVHFFLMIVERRRHVTLDPYTVLNDPVRENVILLHSWIFSSNNTTNILLVCVLDLNVGNSKDSLTQTGEW